MHLCRAVRSWTDLVEISVKKITTRSHKSGDPYVNHHVIIFHNFMPMQFTAYKLQVPNASQVVFLVTELLAAMPNQNIANNKSRNLIDPNFWKRWLACAMRACVRHACLRAPCVAWPLLSPSFSLFSLLFFLSVFCF